MSHSRRTESHPRRAVRRARPRSGLAAIEFALVAPIIILVMLAGADLSLFMRTMMRLDETSSELAITVTQYGSLYDGDFPGLFDAAQILAGSTPVTGLFGTTIITGIVGSGGGKQKIVWQKRSPSATFASLFATVPLLPNSYVVPSGAVLIAVEVFTPASPWVLSAALMGGSGGSSIRSYALYQPRLGSLATVTAGNRP